LLDHLRDQLGLLLYLLADLLDDRLHRLDVGLQLVEGGFPRLGIEGDDRAQERTRVAPRGLRHAAEPGVEERLDALEKSCRDVGHRDLDALLMCNLGRERRLRVASQSDRSLEEQATDGGSYARV